MISEEKILKAATALKAYTEKKSEEKQNLLTSDSLDAGEPVFLVLTGRKFYASEKNVKPKRVSIPHHLYSSDITSVCLFSKDPQREYKNALLGPDCKSKDVLSRVVGVSKLSGKFKPFQARRQLRSGYDIFVAEDNIFDMLPVLLGKSFYQSPKIPLVIKTLGSNGEISDDLVFSQLNEILHSTWFCLPQSATLSIKIGYTSFTPSQIAENVLAVAKYVHTQVFASEDWESVCKSAFIKTEFSPSLPIYLADKVYTKDDVAQVADQQPEEPVKRKRQAVDVVDQEEDPELLMLKDALEEVVDEDDLKEFYDKQEKKKARKAASKTKKNIPETNEQDNEEENSHNESEEEEKVPEPVTNTITKRRTRSQK